MRKVYIASPLFSMAEMQFNLMVRDRLNDHFETFLPQVDGLLVRHLVSKGMPIEQANATVFSRDVSAIRGSDIILAVLDGRVVDEGVCVEIGYAYAINIPIVGLKTDPRQLTVDGDNPMISSVMSHMAKSIDEAIEVMLMLRPKVSKNKGDISRSAV